MSRPKPEPGDDAGRARRVAMDLLARREHSALELARKLAARDFPAELVESVLAALAGEGLQDDARFAEAFVHARYQRGQGPQRVRMELRERGVDDGLVADCLADASLDWQALARQVRERRFGPDEPGDFRERSRQMRFLQQRGFTGDQISGAFDRD